jgi:hypothetical protein
VKILFLDIDGVLNGAEWFERRARPKIAHGMSPDDVERIRAENGIDPACVNRINAIVDRTGCAIVISSTWRLLGPGSKPQHAHMQRMLAHRGFRHSARIIGATPRIERVVSDSGIILASPRGLEIQAWLDAGRYSGPIAILDDLSDMEHLTPRLVQTPWDTGMQDEHIECAVALLEE